MRQLKYREAIDEATRQAMAKDERIFVMGVGADDPKHAVRVWDAPTRI